MLPHTITNISFLIWRIALVGVQLYTTRHVKYFWMSLNDFQSKRTDLSNRSMFDRVVLCLMCGAFEGNLHIFILYLWLVQLCFLKFFSYVTVNSSGLFIIILRCNLNSLGVFFFDLGECVAAGIQVFALHHKAYGLLITVNQMKKTKTQHPYFCLVWFTTMPIPAWTTHCDWKSVRNALKQSHLSIFAANVSNHFVYSFIHLFLF